MPNAQNVAALEQLKTELQGIIALWAVSFNGLTVKDSETLRRSVREAGAIMRVCKNTLMKRALADLDMANMDSILEGPSAFVFTTGDAVAAAEAHEAGQAVAGALVREALLESLPGLGERDLGGLEHRVQA